MIELRKKGDLSMGVWGMGIAQSDEYCEIYEDFMEHYDDGMPVPEITEAILKEYLAEFAPEDGVLHDVYFALAKAQWMTGELSGDIMTKVNEIIDTGANLDFYRELGAMERDLKARGRNLEKFRDSLKVARPNPRKRKNTRSIPRAHAERGEVFWYRSRGRVFGAIVLENIRDEAYFVALSQELPREPKSVDAVLEAEIYDAIWFACLLPQKRLHRLGQVEVTGCYNGRGGLYFSETVQFCESAGIEAEWEHNLLRRRYPDNIMGDLLNAELIPNTFRHEDVLRQRIEMARALYGDEAVKLL